MQIKFKDGTVFTPLTANEKSVYAQGTQRKAIEIQVDKAQFDVLNAATSDSSKTAEITISDESGSYVHNNYCIRAEMALKPVMVTPSTDTAAEADEERACVTLAQLTYLEVQQAAQQAQIDAMTLSTLGVA
ncbi:hypothetical protein CAFE_17920 [Caprobacter fermentans]|uniref:Uncharacterized protein n=1 Tax=Caproicibacter fermentans TaxID=2576756 RepID=A0A6N8HZZ0_9FIRM|nr:hypothetical protein [Caproicibacter fermentans]MVB11090.1 hypothetical protein [Caproicibacter fermentans]